MAPRRRPRLRDRGREWWVASARRDARGVREPRGRSGPRCQRWVGWYMFRRSTASTARASATVLATLTMRQSSPRRLSGGRRRSPHWLRGRRLVGLRQRLARVLTPMCRHGPAEPSLRIWDNAHASIPTSKFCATSQFPGQHLRAVPVRIQQNQDSTRVACLPSSSFDGMLQSARQDYPLAVRSHQSHDSQLEARSDSSSHPPNQERQQLHPALALKQWLRQ